MISYHKGDLLKADAEALINTVNCVGIMGKGIALQFKQKFPENFTAYARACRAGEVQLGRVLVVQTSTLLNPRFIINFPTKYHWHEKSRLENIARGLDSLVSTVQECDIRSIAVPPLGCGNGGLNWGDVRPLIVQAFERVPTVQAYIYPPEGAPDPERVAAAAKRPTLTRARALLLEAIGIFQSGSKRVGLLEIQKIAYLLQVAGEPLRLKYERQQYGPYAHNLNHVLQILDGHYIRGLGDQTQRAQIRLLDNSLDEAQAFLAGDEDATTRLDRVARLISTSKTPQDLELLATIHWVAQENPKAAQDVTAAIAGVHDWSERKHRTFSDQRIMKAWARLQEQGWLDPPAITHQ